MKPFYYFWFPPVEIFHWSHVELKSKVHETGIRKI